MKIGGIGDVIRANIADTEEWIHLRRFYIVVVDCCFDGNGPLGEKFMIKFCCDPFEVIEAGEYGGCWQNGAPFWFHFEGEKNGKEEREKKKKRD